ncbi:MAG: hypothetical protein SGJ20_02605 [Planctomycetota bacterium]|nr:hypothetical protein [Planctomycetota bacterium]
MSTTISAHFDGQHFVPDEPVVGLAPGDCVEIVLVSGSAPPPSVEQDKNFWQWLMENPIPDDGLPADLGYQHDHYLYGTPKKPA